MQNNNSKLKTIFNYQFTIFNKWNNVTMIQINPKLQAPNTEFLRSKNEGKGEYKYSSFPNKFKILNVSILSFWATCLCHSEALPKNLWDPSLRYRFVQDDGVGLLFWACEESQGITVMTGSFAPLRMTVRCSKLQLFYLFWFSSVIFHF